MANKGLQFEWCIYYLVARTDPKMVAADQNAYRQSAANYKSAPTEVKKAALNAVNVVEKKYGKITGIVKISGGDEPKTDLIIKTKKGTLKCSLKYGESIQLSSGGISNTVRFLTGVLENIKKEDGYNKKQVTSIISVLAELDEKYGDIGKMPRHKADIMIGKAERYDQLLKTVIGSRREPIVSEEYAKIKHAIVEEALTGRFTFKGGIKSADHILTDKSITKIDEKFIKSVSDKTSVRIALKGRGKTEVAGKEVRLNEIVVRFDS
jgi:hypothetical protein